MSSLRLFLVTVIFLLLGGCTTNRSTVAVHGRFDEDISVYDGALKSMNDGDKLTFCYADAKISLNIAGFWRDLNISRNEARSMASSGLKGARLRDEYRMIDKLYGGSFAGPTAYAMDRFSACSNDLGLAPGTATMALIETCFGLLNKSRHAFLLRSVMPEEKAEEYMVQRNAPELAPLMRKMVRDAYRARDTTDMVAVDRSHFFSCLSANS